MADSGTTLTPQEQLAQQNKQLAAQKNAKTPQPRFIWRLVPYNCMSCADENNPMNITAGMYCPGKLEKPRLCKAGHYCPSFTEEYVTEVGFYSRDGWTEPKACRGGADARFECNGGAEVQAATGAMRIGLIVVITVLVLLMRLILYLVKERQRVRSKKRVLLKDAVCRLEADLFTRLGVGENYKGNAGLLPGFSNEVEPLPLTFDNVCMTLKQKNAKKNSKEPSKIKYIVDHVTGKFPAGCCAAIMGPSGGGKTSFMNALSGRAASYADVGGEIVLGSEVDGSDRSLDSLCGLFISKFPGEIGFVPQDDVMHEDLTVYQNLYYAALLRLPACMPHSQKMQIVEDVLDVLEIQHIRDSVVGSVKKRGISGGQKKRVNIGLELVAYPKVLFLDEPTSGLDSTASLHVANCLLRLKTLGISVFCVIHQPRYAVFKCFSHLLLLAPGGRTVYLEDTLGIQEYLMRLGFRMPAGENTADWMLDVVGGTVPRFNSRGEKDNGFTTQALCDEWKLESKNRFRDVPKGLSKAEVNEILETKDSAEDNTASLSLAKLKKKIKRSATKEFNLLEKLEAVVREELFPDANRSDEDSKSEDIASSKIPAEKLHITLDMLNFFVNKQGLMIKTKAELQGLYQSLGATGTREKGHTLSLAALLDNAAKKIGATTENVNTHTGENAAKKTSIATKIEQRRRVGFFAQLKILVSRSAMQYDISAFISYSFLIFVMSTVIGMLVGTAFSYAALPSILTVPLVLFGIMSSAMSLGIYQDGIVVFKREGKSSMSVLAFYMSKQIVSFIPNMIILPLVWSAGYWLATSTDCTLFDLTIVYILANWYIAGMAQFISLAVDPSIAILVACMGPALLSTMFGGTGNRTLKDFNELQLAISNISPGRWFSFAAFRTVIKSFPSSVWDLQIFKNGMENYGWDKWTADMAAVDTEADRCLLVLFILGLVFRFLTLVILYMIKHELSLFAMITNVVMFFPRKLRAAVVATEKSRRKLERVAAADGSTRSIGVDTRDNTSKDTRDNTEVSKNAEKKALKGFEDKVSNTPVSVNKDTNNVRFNAISAEVCVRGYDSDGSSSDEDDYDLISV